MPYLNQGLPRGAILLALLVAPVAGAATGPLATAGAATPTPTTSGADSSAVQALCGAPEGTYCYALAPGQSVTLTTDICPEGDNVPIQSVIFPGVATVTTSPAAVCPPDVPFNVTITVLPAICTLGTPTGYPSSGVYVAEEDTSIQATNGTTEVIAYCDLNTSSPTPTPTPVTGLAGASSTPQQASPNAATSTPCTLNNPISDCASTNLKVTVDWWSSDIAQQNGCAFSATVNWGDGTTQSVSIGANATYAPLASHTYAHAGPEVITLGGSVQSGNCAVESGTYYFDPGYACLFYAPHGAPLFGHDNGHVGWAFLKDPNNGRTWEFGANEGPLHGSAYFDTSKTWFNPGASWSAAVATFRNKLVLPGPNGKPKNVLMHPASFYTSVRCQAGTWDGADAANSVVQSQQWSTYGFPLNDCLSEAVAVLNAYGLSLPYNATIASPEAYYSSSALSGWPNPAALTPTPTGPPNL